MSDKNSFEYTYSAERQEEIHQIRKKYGLREDSTGNQEEEARALQELDESIKRPGTILSLTLGILGLLIMGTGMSMVMVWSGALFIPGILVGLIGMAGVAAAYPAYKVVTDKRTAEFSSGKSAE